LPTAEWDETPEFDEQGRQTYPPLEPHGLFVSRAVDVSPMRPDEWFRQRMMPWMRSVLDQGTYNDAVANVQGEASGLQAGMST
jgi:hypothetical protein